MKRVIQIIAVVLFALLLMVPPLHQAWKERQSPDGFQMGHLAMDMFATPLQRRQDIAHGLDSLLVQFDSVHVAMVTGVANSAPDSTFTLPDLEDTAAVWPEPPVGAANDPVLWESLWQQAVQVRQRAQQINHYLSVDSTHAEAIVYGKLAHRMELLYSQVQQGQGVSSAQLDSMRAQADMLYKATMDQCAPLLIARAVVRWTLFNAEYLRAWEKRMEKDSQAAEAMRSKVQVAMYRLFGDLGEKGVVGLGHWNFYRPGVTYMVQPFGSATGENPLDAIDTFRQQLDAMGIALLVVVVPNKESIYPDKISAQFQASDAGRVSHAPRILDSLRARGIAVVDLFSALGSARAADTASLYLQDDTHWTPAGLKIAAAATAQALRALPCWSAALQPVEYVTEVQDVERAGDVVEMSRLPVLGVPFAKQKVQAEVVYNITRDSTGAEIARVPYKDDMRKSRILLLGDSFSRIYQTDDPRNAGFIAHLARALGEPLASLVSDGGASTLVRERLARKPALLKGKKIVVWEFVERDFRFGAEGWKKVALGKTGR